MSQNKQDKGFRFSIRKRSVGVCGVAIATFLLGSGLIFQSNGQIHQEKSHRDL